MKLIGIILGVIIVAALLYYFLPKSIKNAVTSPARNIVTRINPPKTAVPSVRPTASPSVIIDPPTSTTYPFGSANPTITPAPTSTSLAWASATPRVGGTTLGASTSASATPSANTVARVNNLPGTGEKEIILGFQILASFGAMFAGWKLSKFR